MVTIREAGQLATTPQKAILWRWWGDAVASVGHEEALPFRRYGERLTGWRQLGSTVGSMASV